MISRVSPATRTRVFPRIVFTPVINSRDIRQVFEANGCYLSRAKITIRVETRVFRGTPANRSGKLPIVLLLLRDDMLVTSKIKTITLKIVVSL